MGGGALKKALKEDFNLLLKGNNLLALHSLKKKFAKQVKLIYIDPPYNTGNDSFNYNDKFSHSTWLVFMKNRLEIAREFLREDGVIFIQCDDNEQAYLKVLCDELFGRENFVGCIVRQTKIGGGGNAKFYATEHDYILNYAKNIEKLNDFFMSYNEEYLKRYKEEDFKGKYFWDTAQRKIVGEPYDLLLPNGVTINGYFLYKKERMEEMLKNGDAKADLLPNGKWSVKFKQRLNEKGQKPRSLTMDLGSTIEASKELEKLFNEKIFAFPKPEALLKRIIEISTNEGDLVMDFFAGSGTTLAVAHKMKRRWIGIEQMDYIKDITKERLKKVVDGEQGGISKAVQWSGGGSFVYAEFMPLNASYKEKIEKSKDEKDLDGIYQELKTKAFLDYRVDIKELLKDKEFENLSLENKKEILRLALDSNMDYVLYGDIDDEELGFDKELKELNQSFYKDSKDE